TASASSPPPATRCWPPARPRRCPPPSSRKWRRKGNPLSRTAGEGGEQSEPGEGLSSDPHPPKPAGLAPPSPAVRERGILRRERGADGRWRQPATDRRPRLANFPGGRRLPGPPTCRPECYLARRNGGRAARRRR